MSKDKHVSDTPAIVWLRQHKVPFKLHTYPYVEHGGTELGARSIGVDHHLVVKTLIMEDEEARPLVLCPSQAFARLSEGC